MTKRIRAFLAALSLMLAVAAPASAAQLFTSFIPIAAGGIVSCIVTNVTDKDVPVTILALHDGGEADQVLEVVLGPFRTELVLAGRVFCAFIVRSKNSVRANATVRSSTGEILAIVPAQ